MVSTSWQLTFPYVSLSNLLAPISYHIPILLQTKIDDGASYSWSFRFENKWLRETELLPIIQNSWDILSELDLLSRLSSCFETLSSWGRQLTSEFRRSVVDC